MKFQELQNQRGKCVVEKSSLNCEFPISKLFHHSKYCRSLYLFKCNSHISSANSKPTTNVSPYYSMVTLSLDFRGRDKHSLPAALLFFSELMDGMRNWFSGRDDNAPFFGSSILFPFFQDIKTCFGLFTILPSKIYICYHLLYKIRGLQDLPTKTYVGLDNLESCRWAFIVSADEWDVGDVNNNEKRAIDSKNLTTKKNCEKKKIINLPSTRGR